jgi:hypothetical protein
MLLFTAHIPIPVADDAHGNAAEKMPLNVLRSSLDQHKKSTTTKTEATSSANVVSHHQRRRRNQQQQHGALNDPRIRQLVKAFAEWTLDNPDKKQGYMDILTAKATAILGGPYYPNLRRLLLLRVCYWRDTIRKKRQQQRQQQQGQQQQQRLQPQIRQQQHTIEVHAEMTQMSATTMQKMNGVGWFLLIYILGTTNPISSKYTPWG